MGNKGKKRQGQGEGQGGQGQGSNKGKGKAKGKGKGSVQPGARPRMETQDEPKYKDKPYEDAVNDLIDNTALEVQDFDMWCVKVLDALDEKAEEACMDLKAALKGREREAMKNPKAYVFTLLTKFKKEVRGETPKSPEGGISASPFRLDAPEFVPGAPLPAFSFNAQAPEFKAPLPAFSFNGQAPEFKAPLPAFSFNAQAMHFNAQAPEFVMPGSTPQTPEMGPKAYPFHTPDHAIKAYNGQPSFEGMMANCALGQDPYLKTFA